MESKDQKIGEQEALGYFVTTRWSIILASRGSRTETEKARDALAQLCRIYWRPVRDYIRRRGHCPHDAQDLAQDFFMKIINTDFLLRADRERGKFRGLLLTSLQNFLTNLHNGKKADKRDFDIISMEDLNEEDTFTEAETDWTPERMFDAGWAATISKRALSQLHDECVRAGRERVFTELSPFLAMDVDEWKYRKAAEVLGVPEATTHTLVNRLRERYRTLLRLEVAETVGENSEIEEELRYLHRLLATETNQ